MLAKLWIKNFALIQELKADFSNGYTVITGETGSGKSILLGALNLILGERADYSLIGPDADKTFVEAEFLLKDLDLIAWFNANDIDYEDRTLVRREINRSGRSRAFINDTPVSLVQIKQLTEHLININSQHNTLALRDKNFHLELLDVLAGLEEKVQVFEGKFASFRQRRSELKAMKLEVEQAEKDKDYLVFQLEELESLNLNSVDYSSLEQELNRQENMEDLTSALSAISSGLSEEGSVLEQLKSIVNQLSKAQNSDDKVLELSKRIESAVIEMEDVSDEASNYLEQLEKDPQKILELTSKVDAYNRILQKHKCTNQQGLIGQMNTWQAQISVSDEGRLEIDKLEIQLANEEVSLQKVADALHNSRKKSAPQIEKKISVLLDDLKMPNTTVKFDVQHQEQLSAKGNSTISMLFSSNAGIPLQAMDKVASGGELSRLMLSVQCLISEMKSLPTIIFDEIDTGVSGEVAQKIGQLLRRMGSNRQLIAISHLPQVAGKASSHIKVEKSENNGRVESRLRFLTNDERVEEIARLMSGEVINEAALTNAKNLMEE